jgi:hypothetical protein
MPSIKNLIWQLTSRFQTANSDFRKKVEPDSAIALERLMVYLSGYTSHQNKMLQQQNAAKRSFIVAGKKIWLKYAGGL